MKNLTSVSYGLKSLLCRDIRPTVTIEYFIQITPLLVRNELRSQYVCYFLVNITLHRMYIERRGRRSTHKYRRQLLQTEGTASHIAFQKL